MAKKMHNAVVQTSHNHCNHYQSFMTFINSPCVPGLFGLALGVFLCEGHRLLLWCHFPASMILGASLGLSTAFCPCPIEGGEVEASYVPRLAPEWFTVFCGILTLPQRL